MKSLLFFCNVCRKCILFSLYTCITHKKMKFSIKDFFRKCDQIRRKLRIWSHLLKKFLMEKFLFFLQCFQCHDYQVYVFIFLSICYRIHGSLKILFYYFLNLDFSDPIMTIEEKNYLAQKL